MLLSFITPTAYIKDYQSQGDFVLALAHLMDRHSSNKYERAILDTGQDIILDNSLFENHVPEGIDSLITKALRVNATHFFSPDILYDARATLEALNNTIYVLNQRKAIDKIKIAAVVQASTEEEFFWLYDRYQEIPEIDLIGLSCLAIPRCFGSYSKSKHTKKEAYKHYDNQIVSSRIKLMEKMIKRGNNNKKCHLLGLGDSYSDVIFAKNNCSWIISNDTSSCFWNAMQGKKILDNGDVEGGKTKVKVNFDYKDAEEDQLILAQYNINKIKELCAK